MQLIFLSTLECRSADGTSATAQVSITEHQGAFRVLWAGETQDGKGEQEAWFEGPAWKDMLQAYREGLWQKRLAGYYPLVDTSLQTSGEGARSREQLMLQFYAETHHNPELFQELRKWRRQQAQKESKSAYFVATNRMLHMVTAFLPHTMEELRQIPGFGKRKAEAYGNEILAVTAGRERLGDFPLHWVYGEVDQGQFEVWLVRQLKSKEELEEQRERMRRLVLEGAEAGLTLKELAETTGQPRRELVLLLEELDQQGYNMEPIIAAELTGMELDKLDEDILMHPRKSHQNEIIGLRSEIMWLKNVLGPQKNVIMALTKKDLRLVDENLQKYFNDIYENAVKIHETFDTFRDLIGNLREAYQLSLSNRMNDIMRMFTALTTIFMPMTIITSLYGMNFDNMPELHWRYGYYGVLGLLVGVGAAMFYLFRKKEWL